MNRYSAFSLLKNAFSDHRHWPRAWRSPELKPHYDVVIIGGGGHGLATAWYLAKEHGISNIAVLEKGWLGGGNTGRNTAVSRSNYFYPESTRFYEHSLKRYETLGRDLNFNIMLSQIGIINLACSRHEMEIFRRWATAIQLQGVDSEVLSREQIAEMVPLLNMSAGARYPVHGGFIQRRGGISRHDAVAWGYARAADSLGVDLIQNCEVTGIDVNDGRIRGVRTNRGTVRTDKVGMAVAGHSTVVAAMAGVKLPIVSQTLQAMVSEPVKPCLDHVVMSPMVHCYISQSDRGEIVIGGGADTHPSYGQRGSLPATEAVLNAAVELYPMLSRMKLMRQWGGIVDIAPDASPIVSKTPVSGFYISTGWGTGGYKAIPAGGETFAHTIAHDAPHPLVEPFSLDRFARGRLIDEGAAAGVAH
ncbi:sarcosine oxidase subunit beta [Kineobactrum sediminis]|uniref:Sarcosine oxidase subunit beta n=1 Tax=Kineobactrum sediminis TaxID=1905677 RepID=A0A2N5Y3U2_9GAMM|nr:sarcosine oxidase subunit beta family protein [Kineobactrum sediminis]PLW83063.1 sarcosine oxidase subunit beta [Kineobactrum sediminis]